MAKLVSLAQSGEQRQEAATVLVAATVEPEPIVLPASLELCLKRSLRARQQAKPKQAAARKQGEVQSQPSDGVAVQPASPSADALLLAELKTKRQRELCAYELLKWHEAQRVKVAAKK